jgi:hypothetical protein
VFRHLSTTRGEIYLGAVLDPIWVHEAERGTEHVALPRGTVAGAQSALVSRNAQGRVREIMLNYDQATDFDAHVARYRRSLGPPASHMRPAHPEGAERIIWRDARTSFELVRDPRRSVSTIYGRLTDRTTTSVASPTEP